MSQAYKRALEAKEFLEKKTKLRPKIGLVLGSGLGAFAEQVKADVVLSFGEIPGFTKPTVEGHGGKLIIGTLAGVPVACQQGRVHYYEGHAMENVVHPVRTLGLFGVKTLLLTNAAGGIKDGLAPGDLMVIRDHMNLMGANPLLGPNVGEFGPRFPDMSNVYSQRIRDAAKAVFAELKVKFVDGVYCGLSGPTYETPAEVQYLKKIGADVVGMSTVPEAIAARHMGVEVGAISCVTNLAAGIATHELSHSEVTETSKKVEAVFASTLTKLVSKIV